MNLILEHEYNLIDKGVVDKRFIRKVKHNTRRTFRSLNPDIEDCVYCGCKMEKATSTEQNPQTATVEHVVSPTHGGKYNDLDNMIYACCECNRAKADRLLLDFIFNDIAVAS
jgi:5-methylcytosine-specific restriction endonuclease McrA